MKTKAAVACKAGVPLTIKEVELQGPHSSGALVRLLDRINEGFDLMKRGESIRSVVVY
ncbi:MAG TPA: zinc-binding alcohol dehydrogenase [Paenalcaligenes sp.]|nr:zinc-binding alcohol dehydrogenase [Paenalcaligenes sp.]